MLKTVQYLVLFFAVLLIVGCGGGSYKVTTTAGDTYYALERPSIEEETNRLVFKDPQGKEVILERDKVDVIQQSDIPKESK